MAKREKDYSCNPAKCSCKNGKYSIIIIGNSVVMCHEIIETTKTIPTKGIPTKNDPTRSITTKNISEKTSPIKNTLMEKRWSVKWKVLFAFLLVIMTSKIYYHFTMSILNFKKLDINITKMESHKLKEVDIKNCKYYYLITW